ncbi:MAG: hypothetical protein AAFR21_10110 [Pseudomonadota bacterium]
MEIGSFDIDQVHRPTATPHNWTGTYFDVWQRQSSGPPVLISQAWNYDKAFDGIRELAHFKLPNSVPAHTLPGVPISDPKTYEIRALREMGTQAMLTNQPAILPFIYSEDGMYAPHDAPALKGREEIAAFLKDYTANWPPFDYVDVSTDRLDFSDAGVVEHMSYNLRWIGEGQTGVSIGKGIRIWTRNKDGMLQSYRQIAMHEF